MTDIQAALALVQLGRLDEFLARRKAIAQRYTQALSNHPIFVPPFVPDGMDPNWQSYQITVRKDVGMTRDHVMEHLFSRGIHTRRGVMASHLEPAYRDFARVLPETEKAARSTLQLPIYPDLSLESQNRVLDALNELVDKAHCAADETAAPDTATLR
jgi:perosamine synthetase